MKSIKTWKELLSGEFDRPAWRDEDGEREALLPLLDAAAADTRVPRSKTRKLLRAIERSVDDYVANSEYLKALAILKLADTAGCPNEDLKRILKGLLRTQNSRAVDGEDPLPREFLGTPRLHIAWSVLTRDKLAIVPDEPKFGSDSWVLARGADAGPTATPWALVWWGRTEVAGKVRPAGRRTVSRRKLELTAAVALLGRANPRQGPTRFTAQITDLTPRGAGIEVKDRFDRLHGIQLKDKRIRIALRVPGRAEPISTLGLICWTEDKGGERDIRMGIKFVDPLPEFMEGVAELLSSRRDVQYLWNLIESNIGNADNTGS